jgi:hypothetical protein
LELVVNDIPDAIKKIATDCRARSPVPEDYLGLWDQAVSSCLSERLNDASLLLGKISELQLRQWPEMATQRNADALQRAAAATRRLYLCAKDWEKDYAWLEAAMLKAKVIPAIVSLCQCVTKGRGQELQLNLQKAKGVFLDLAVDVETILGYLVDDDEAREKAEADGAELESLTANIGGLKL